MMIITMASSTSVKPFFEAAEVLFMSDDVIVFFQSLLPSLIFQSFGKRFINFFNRFIHLL